LKTEQFECSEETAFLLSKLTPTIREIVWLRYAEQLTVEKVADKVGLSPARVSQILAGAVERWKGRARGRGERAAI
jgi:RNA polymerase sigma factor (sigma-70 family)